MLPRLSFYVANGQIAEFDRMLRKSFSFVFLMCLPIIAGMYGRQTVIAAGDLSKFYVVLASILLLCAGATILQVCGNPVMRDVSPQGKFSSNLSLAQSVKAVGSSMGFLLLPLVAKPLGLSWSVQYPIFAAALVIALCACLPLTLAEESAAQRQPATLGS